MMKSRYSPPFKISSEIIQLISHISEWIGSYAGMSEAMQTPMLRRGNRLRSIQASLAIENNTLNLEQVTAVIEGKRVLGNPLEIQEVRNTFAVYEIINELDPTKIDDFLKAHNILMFGLVDLAGKLRTGDVGVMNEREVVHVAPPAIRVPYLITDLFNWMTTTDVHPLIVSSVSHYEIEFIHPFADGNGRMGRLWQTLILNSWKPIFAYLPVETVIRTRQKEYYDVLTQSDKEGHSTAFIEFMLNAIFSALQETKSNDQVSDQVSDQVRILLNLLENQKMSTIELMNKLNLIHRPSFRKHYIHPALNEKLIEMTITDKPNSRLQKYQLTSKGQHLLKRISTSE